MSTFRPKPQGRYPTHRAALRDPDCEEFDRKGRRRWRAWWEGGVRSYAAVQVPGVRDLARRLRRMSGWREVTHALLDEMERLSRDLAELARWHAGAQVEPAWTPPEGRKPRFGASYARAAAEVARSVALGRARLEGAPGVGERRPASAYYPPALDPEESRRRMAEWDEKVKGRSGRSGTGEAVECG